RLHRPPGPRGLVLVRGRRPDEGEPDGRPPGTRARVRPDGLPPGGHAGRRPVHARARPAPGGRVGGRDLAGDPRGVVRDPRRALRRIPLAAVVGQQRLEAGQGPNAPGCGPGKLMTCAPRPMANTAPNVTPDARY